MTVRVLALADFESTIRDNPIVLVDFWAPLVWPMPGVRPIFERSAQDHPDIVHAKVDTDVERELAAMAGIRSIPTTIAFGDGVLVYSQPGAMPLAVLADLIGRVKALDMTTVRAKIVDRKAAAKT